MTGYRHRTQSSDNPVSHLVRCGLCRLSTNPTFETRTKERIPKLRWLNYKSNFVPEFFTYWKCRRIFAIKVFNLFIWTPYIGIDSNSGFNIEFIWLVSSAITVTLFNQEKKWKNSNLQGHDFSVSVYDYYVSVRQQSAFRKSDSVKVVSINQRKWSNNRHAYLAQFIVQAPFDFYGWIISWKQGNVLECDDIYQSGC